MDIIETALKRTCRPESGARFFLSEGVSGRLLLGVFAALLGGEQVYAEHVQTVGVGARARALAGAVVSDSAPSDAIYSNPAGAAWFDDSSFSSGLLVIDTRTASYRDSEQYYAVEGTIEGSSYGLLPEFSMYKPLANGMVWGFGFNAPYGLSADLANVSGALAEGNTAFQIISGQLASLLAIPITEKLSIGATLNAQILEHFTYEAVVNFGLLGVPVGLDGDGNDLFRLESKGNVRSPLPPENMRVELGAPGFTIGLQYQETENLSFGLTYRSAQTSRFESEVSIGADGEKDFTADALAEIGYPAHIQLGMSLGLSPSLRLLLDGQKTFWSSTQGFGEPQIFDLYNWEATEGASLLDQGVEQVLQQIDGMELDFKAKDASALRVGLEWQPPDLQNWTLRGGYWYDPSPFPDGSTAYTPGRDTFTLGAGYSRKRSNGRNLAVDFGLTYINLKDREQPDFQIYTSLGALLNAVPDGIIESDGTGKTIYQSGHILVLGADLTYKF